MRKAIRLSYQRALLKINILLSVLNSTYSMWLLLLVLTVAKPLQWHLEILFQVIIPGYKVVGISKNRKRTIYSTAGYEGENWLQMMWFPGQSFMQSPSSVSIHITWWGDQCYSLDPACSSLFTPCGHHVPSWRWAAGSSWVFSTHPSSDAPWRREREVLSRSRPLGCPTTWNPELCTDPT